MPKIPSYTAQVRPTTDINIPKSGVQMPITAPFTGLQNIGNKDTFNGKVIF